MEVRDLVVCRQMSPSTGDPNRDRYNLEKVVRVAPAEGLQIVQLLADGERVGAARCQLIDSPPLQALSVSGAIGDVLYPG